MDTSNRVIKAYSETGHRLPSPIHLAFENPGPIEVTYGETYRNKITDNGEKKVCYSIIKDNAMDPEIVRINSKGDITPIRAGMVKIRAISEKDALYDSTIAEYCLTVTKAPQFVSFMYDSKDIAPIYVGERFCNPFDFQSMKAHYKIISGNPELVKIDADGYVTALGAGEVSIQATAETDDRYDAASLSYTLRILDGKPIYLSLSEPKQIEITYGERCKAEINGISKKRIKYSIVKDDSNDLEIVRINRRGIITPIRAGKVVIRAICQGNQSEANLAELFLTVTKAHQHVSFVYDSKDIAPISIGDKFCNPFHYQSAKARYEIISEIPNLVKIGKDGCITAVGAGTVTIQATAEADDRYEAASISYSISILESKAKQDYARSEDDNEVMEEWNPNTDYKESTKNPVIRIGMILHYLMSLSPEESTSIKSLSEALGIPLNTLRGDILNMCRDQYMANLVMLLFQREENGEFAELETDLSDSVNYRKSRTKTILGSTLHAFRDKHLYDDCGLKACFDPSVKCLILNAEERKSLHDFYTKQHAANLSSFIQTIYRSGCRNSKPISLDNDIYDKYKSIIGFNQKCVITEKSRLNGSTKKCIAQPIALYSDAFSGLHYVACLEDSTEESETFLRFHEVLHTEIERIPGKGYNSSLIKKAKKILEYAWAPQDIRIDSDMSNNIHDIELLIEADQQNTYDKIIHDLTSMTRNQSSHPSTMEINQDPKNGSYTMKMKVSCGTNELKKWLLSYGSSIMVKSPEALAAEIKNAYECQWEKLNKK